MVVLLRNLHVNNIKNLQNMQPKPSILRPHITTTTKTFGINVLN